MSNPSNSNPNSPGPKKVCPPKSDSSMAAFWKQTKANLSDTKGLLWILLFIFLTTFIVFPGVTEATTLGFLNGISQEVSWFILFQTTMFNIFDTIGRKCGGCIMLSNNSVILWSMVRIIFVGTFMLTAFQVSVPFNSDWFKILNMALFAISNGYLSTLCAIKAPQTVEGERKGQVGAFIGITISTGIMLGSILAYAMGAIIANSPGEKDFQTLLE